jgi:Tfp pilus assembly protein PilE
MESLKSEGKILMDESISLAPAARRNERGAARLKFIIVLVVVAILGYMALQYIPVAYQSYTFKKFMNETADKAAAMSLPAEEKAAWLENELRAKAKDYSVPPDAKITRLFQNNQMQVTVQFTRQLNMIPGIWSYQYNFDHTAKSSTFLTAQ